MSPSLVSILFDLNAIGDGRATMKLEKNKNIRGRREWRPKGIAGAWHCVDSTTAAMISLWRLRRCLHFRSNQPLLTNAYSPSATEDTRRILFISPAQQPWQMCAGVIISHSTRRVLPSKNMIRPRQRKVCWFGWEGRILLVDARLWKCGCTFVQATMAGGSRGQRQSQQAYAREHLRMLPHSFTPCGG